MKTSVLIPDELFERLKVRAAAEGVSVSALLIAGVSGPAVSSGDGPRLAELVAEAAALQDDCARLKRELAAARSKPASNGEAERAHPRPVSAVNLKAHHQSGPVLESAVPQIDGETGWSNLKGSKK